MNFISDFFESLKVNSLPADAGACFGALSGGQASRETLCHPARTRHEGCGRQGERESRLRRPA